MAASSLNKQRTARSAYVHVLSGSGLTILEVLSDIISSDARSLKETAARAAFPSCFLALRPA
jgi:homoserine kinase